MAKPSIEEQIAALLRITARLEAGGVVMSYPDELPSLNAAIATLSILKMKSSIAEQIADELIAEAEQDCGIRHISMRNKIVATLSQYEAVIEAAREVFADHPGALTVEALVKISRIEPVIIQPLNRLASALAALDTAETEQKE